MQTKGWETLYEGCWKRANWIIERYDARYHVFRNERNILTKFDTFEEAAKYCEDNLI